MKACVTDECKNCGGGESSCSRFDVFLAILNTVLWNTE